MARLSNYEKLGLLDYVYDAAGKAGVRLKAALWQAHLNPAPDVAAGQIQIGVSGNGSSVTLAIPSQYTITPRDTLAAFTDLYYRSETCRANLIAAGHATPTDAQVKSEMEPSLLRRNSLGADFSQMRAR